MVKIRVEGLTGYTSNVLKPNTTALGLVQFALNRRSVEELPAIGWPNELPFEGASDGGFELMCRGDALHHDCLMEPLAEQGNDQFYITQHHNADSLGPWSSHDARQAYAAASAPASASTVGDDPTLEPASSTVKRASSVVPQDSAPTEGTVAQPEAQQPAQTTEPAAITSEAGSNSNKEPESPTSELLFSPRSLANVTERLDQLDLMLNSDDFFNERDPELERLQAEVIGFSVFLPVCLIHCCWFVGLHRTRVGAYHRWRVDID